MFILSTLKRRFIRKVNKYFMIVTCTLIAYYMGAFTFLFTLDYDSSFNYPLEWDIVECAVVASKGKIPECPIINKYDYEFVVNDPDKCNSEKGEIRLVMIIKSSYNNFERRKAIRLTWGNEQRFADVSIKRVFILGKNADTPFTKMINEEIEEHEDIIQSDFIDSYYNNTIKTMMGFKWSVNHCPNGRFFLFCDDDMYVSVKNILKFLRNPTEYPQYLETSDNSAVARFRSKALNYELAENVKLIAGFVLQSTPHRHQCSKWYASLDEYPYNKWPPYVSAGSYIVSKEALKLLYYGSFFTKHFRFDDIYLGLIARKMNIEPFHSSYFHIFSGMMNRKYFKYALTSHGYTPQELQQTWIEQKTLGNA